MSPPSYTALDFGFDSYHPLEHLLDKGLAHTHIRIVGTGYLARIPKQSQLDLDAKTNLQYQKACFERAALGHSTPALLRAIEPNKQLPHGALIVQEIIGHSINLTTDLDALAHSLAAIHLLDCPEAAQRPPLFCPADPILEVLQEIEHHLIQANYVSNSTNYLSAAIERNIRHVKQAVTSPNKPPIRLIGFDVHPGNFILARTGTAFLVDLEKCRYSYAGFDLAHATQYTSTTWDTATNYVLSVAQIAQFYATWSTRIQANAGSRKACDRDSQWFGVLRRVMWLWSISWCLKWQVVSRETNPDIAHHGENWSESQSDPALIAHVRERVEHYLSHLAIDFFQSEANDLDKLWGKMI
jgi:thiamine kinase-like enzyme